MSKKKIDDVLAAMRPTGAPVGEVITVVTANPPPAPAPLPVHPLTQVAAQPSAMDEIEALHKRLAVEPDEIEREKIVERLEAVEMSAMADAAKESETRRVFSDEGPRPPALEPTIGRIVHYRAGTGRTYAAMIVFVYPDSHHVNLTIFSYEGHVSAIERVSFGHELGNWRWPPRV